MPDDAADTAPTPADNPTGNVAQGTPASSAPVTPAVDLNAVLADNRRLQEEREKLQGQYAQVRKWATKSAQDAAQYKRQLEEGGHGSGIVLNDPASGMAAGFDNESIADIAEVKFKMNHPDWNKTVDKQTGKTVWDEMNAILFDDVRSSELVGRTPYLTLKNIHREVQNQRMSAELKAARAAQVPNRSVITSHAEMSGQGASIPMASIDISDPNMTAEQLLEAADKSGMLEGLVDPNDPPSWMRR
jgi:hypothetical protein